MVHLPAGACRSKAPAHTTKSTCVGSPAVGVPASPAMYRNSLRLGLHGTSRVGGEEAGLRRCPELRMRQLHSASLPAQLPQQRATTLSPDQVPPNRWPCSPSNLNLPRTSWWARRAARPPARPARRPCPRLRRAPCPATSAPRGSPAARCAAACCTRRCSPPSLQCGGASLRPRPLGPRWKSRGGRRRRGRG